MTGDSDSPDEQSYAWKHEVYGPERFHGVQNGTARQTVFTVLSGSHSVDGLCFFVGRVIWSAIDASGSSISRIRPSCEVNGQPDHQGGRDEQH